MMDLCVGVVTLVGGGRIDRSPSNTFDNGSIEFTKGQQYVRCTSLYVGAFEGILWLKSHETIEKDRYIGST